MAYDERLAEELRSLLESRLDGAERLSEKKMFGGLAFLVSGHMAVGVVKQSGMFRLGPDGATAALDHGNVRPMDFTGRPSRGMVFADPPSGDGVPLGALVDGALSFVRTLPAREQ